MIKWYKGSGLRPYLEKQRIKSKTCTFFPPQKDNNVLLSMPRLFFVAKI
ncbi:hypothetical protein [Campylobacter sp. US33a]|uniref:Uncharacterized protein n=1 Tax=Campylobacter sp. CCS1377 TaxID=3158229 RepID=A0AAU7E941_9BACT|nr:hypothetical protein [Campylobacter sp. US33a]MCW1361149.1 hypothetical protein [Campylobacter jejuni]